MSLTNSAIPSIYNPGSLSTSELKSSFVIRMQELNLLLDEIRQDKMDKPGQHFIVQGQRGSGKTTLLLMIKYTVVDDHLLNSWLIPVIFSEEQYNITKLYKLWESIARYLEEEDSLHGLFNGLENEMKKHPDIDDYESVCYEILINALEKNNKKLLLLIDNFGDMIGKFNNKEIQRLREILITSSNIKIIGGTAVTLAFQANYSHSFYEFFRIIPLEGLTSEETIDLLKKFAEIRNESEKINKILTERPEQVEALRILTGGVPRTIAMLYEIFADNVNGEAFKNLEILIDRITPIYTIKLNDVPPAQQEILDALALNWDAMTVKEIAASTRMKSKGISVQINRLVKDNIVVKIDTSTKNYLYMIRERFFNIWYLMRYGSKKSENRVKWLTQFIECWLNEEEIIDYGERFRNTLETASPYSRYALYMTAAIAETKAYSKNKDSLIESAKLYLTKADPALVCELPKTGQDLLSDAIVLFDKNDFTSAIRCLSKISYRTHLINFALGLAYHQSSNFQKAEEYYLLAVEKGNADAMNNLALIYENVFKDLNKAEEYYFMAVEKGDVSAMNNLALLYKNEFGDINKAEEYYLKAVEKGDAGAMFNLALLYENEFKDIDKAKEYYIMGVEKGEARAMFNLALMYKNDFNNIDKAEEYYLMAVEKGDAGAMFNLALLYEDEFKDINKAEEYYLMAVEKGEARAMFNLALMYKNDFNNIDKAVEYYLLATEKGDATAMYNLALLYNNELKDIKKAEECYIKAVEKGHISAMFNLALLYENEFKDINKAEENYLMAVEKGHTRAMFNLALMYENEFKDIDKAEEYYIMAVEKGDTRAMFNLALMYKNELNNIPGAIELLDKASKLGYIKAKINLALIYFNKSKSKINFINLANELSDNEEAKKEFDIIIDMITIISLLWENKADKAIEMIEQTKVKILLFASDVNESAFDLLLLLLAKKQYNYVHNLFKDNDLSLKDKLKPIYYAVMYLMKEDYPDEYKKMGSELQPVFDDILKKIKEMEIKYV